jgi:hypothetical protein
MAEEDSDQVKIRLLIDHEMLADDCICGSGRDFAGYRSTSY